MTSRLTLNSSEVSAILPGLETMLNGIATLRMGGQVDPFEFCRVNIHVDPNIRFDKEMSDHLLACRNKLKWLNPSRKVRLNSFEIAAAALALRVVRKLGLAAAEVINTEAVNALARKLELHRKRAKRSAIQRLGTDGYRAAATRWRLFAKWIRLKILIPPSRLDLEPLRSISMLKKEQRETMRQLVRDVVVDGTPEADIRRWADLARWEIWRGRHPTRLREFLSDHQAARAFLANFIMRRAGMEVLRLEFIPRVLRMSLRFRDFKRSLLRWTDDTAPLATPCGSSTPSVITLLDETTLAATEAALPIHEPNSENQPELQPALGKEELVQFLKTWFVNEVDPGYYQDVADEIRFQVWNFYPNQLIPVQSTSPDNVIEQSRPVYDIPYAGSSEITAYLAGWARNWLVALNPDPLIVYDAVRLGLSAAQTLVKSLSPLTYQSKMSEIHRRYFQ